jgi:hypothetical protein
MVPRNMGTRYGVLSSGSAAAVIHGQQVEPFALKTQIKELTCFL